MTDISLDREAMTLFEAMLEAAPADSDQWIEAHTTGRPDLRARLGALLAADRTIMLRTGGAVDAIEETPPPEVLGGYRLKSRIGHGGMGSVYRAERERGDFTHAAAVKIIKPGLLSERLVERFRRERQILAQLSHPNIAQLFDGGETEDGSPYIVMEFIEGQPLLSWADAHRPGREARIELFLQICSAVAFAHRNLIVHRDITPSNVLVTGDGRAKLIDFGISRAVETTRIFTPIEGLPSLQSLSLTPGYAAPERMTGAEVTTAADIYSLGKLLLKLMADAAEDDAELASIAGKATQDAPQARYGAVEELAADIEAWRDSRPVAAHGASGRYVFGKFVARHRGVMIAAASGIVLLLGAFVATGISYLRAEQARAAEAARFGEVRSLARYLMFDLNDQLRGVPGNTAARADLAAKAQLYLDTLSQAPGASRDLRHETALGFIRLAEIQNSPLDRNLGLMAPSVENLEKARTILAALREDEGDAPDIAVAEGRLEAIAGMIAFYSDTDAGTARTLLDRGAAALARVPVTERSPDWHLARRDLSRAEMEYHSANEEFDALIAVADAHDALVDAWPDSLKNDGRDAVERAYALYNRGLAWSLMDREAEGYPAMRQAHDMFVVAERAHSGEASLLYLIGWSGADAYAAGARLEKAVEAEDVLMSAVAAAKRLVAVEDRDESAAVLNTMVGEAWSQHLSNTGRFREAIAEQQRIVGVKRTKFEDGEGAGADLGWSEMILGLIAKSAGDRPLMCASWTSANAHFLNAQEKDRLGAFHAAFLPGLKRNLDLCASQAPISDFGPLR